VKPRLLLDTNLLVLLIAGSTDRKLIGAHKRVQTFTSGDYDLLIRFMAGCRELITCPNVLTEASNLLLGGTDGLSLRLAAVFSRLIGSLAERAIASATAAAQTDFTRLGLTDAVILCLLEPGTVLLTADLHLCLAAQRAGGDAVNFNHQRLL
jgi:hypothetical protein